MTKLHRLPIEERMRLVEDLWDSISADQCALTLSTEQKNELDNRLNTYEIDNIKGRLATEVLNGSRKKLPVGEMSKK
jgi:putative addiction module component (TIGR02574 family)